METLRLVPLQQIPLAYYTRLRDRLSISEPRQPRYAGHEGIPQYEGYAGELMASGEALMAKKVVGDVMIIQKNADAPAHPRPPAWTRKDLDAQWRAVDF